MSQFELAKSLTGEWKPVRHTLGYRVSVGLVALVMLCLPVIYFAIIAAAAYGVYWHFTTNMDWFEGARGRAVGFVALAWAAPGLAGTVVILFLLKPLFAPPAKREPGLVLEEFEEQRLYGFVNTVCGVIGAPPPRRIEVNSEVNASAGLRRGWLSLFLPGDLVLVVGTPLVAGMTVGQFAGVLAHEFGHFAQGSGMRSTFLIHSIMRWFARAAYERDGWDEKLDEVVQEGGHWAIQAVGLLAKLCVGVTRLVLIVLLWIARVLGAVMSRQMEFDADRYQSRFVGAQVYESGMLRLYELSRGEAVAEGLAHEMWKKKREVPDDIGSLVADAADRLDPETRDAVKHQATVDNTGLFDTHPSTAARIRAVKKREEPGVFHCELPASVLLSDFRAASVKASYGHYQERLGAFLYDATFVSPEEMLKRRREEAKREKRAEAYLGFRPPTWRPLFLSATELKPPMDPKETIARVRAARGKLGVMRGRLAEHAEQYRKATEKGVQAFKAGCVFEMGFTFLPKDLGLKYLSRAAVDDDKSKCRDMAAASAAVIDEAMEYAAARMLGSLQLLRVTAIDQHLKDAEALRARAKALVPALAGFRQVHRTMMELREELEQVSVLGYLFEKKGKEEEGKKKLRALSDGMRDKLEHIRREGGPYRYPFSGEGEVTNVGERLVGATPGWREYEQIIDAAYGCVERYPAEYGRVLGELVEIAERVEGAVVREPVRKGEEVKR